MLKDWSKLEKILLFGSITTISLVSIIFKSDLLHTICSILIIISTLLVAKGKNLGNIVGIIATIIYSIVSYINRFYGEVIICLVLIIPFYTAGIISWAKHKNEETNTVKIDKISKKEWLLILIVGIITFIAIYYLLKYFNTNELLVSTISVINSLFATYLQVRRSKYCFCFYILNDFTLLILWGIPVILGNLLVLPMIFEPIVNLINDLYGFQSWNKLENK